MEREDRVRILLEKREDLLSKIREVYSIFTNFYGEDRVDLWLPNSLTSDDSYIDEVMEITPLEIDGFDGELGVDDSYEENKREEIEYLPEELFTRVVNSLAFKKHLRQKFYMSYLSNFYEGGAIIVHYPHILISNENGATHHITHLYTKIPVTFTGFMATHSFGITRTEFTDLEILSDYLHSHIPGLPKTPGKFLKPCLGQGPIRRTITTLMATNDPLMWQLFIVEMDKFVEVESLNGGPYRRISHINGSTREDYTYSTYGYNMRYRSQAAGYSLFMKYIHEFIEYALSKKIFNFGIRDGVITLNMTSQESVLVLSDAFLEWVNILPPSHPYIQGISNVADNEGFSMENYLKAVGFLVTVIVEGDKVKVQSTDAQHNYFSLSTTDSIFKFRGNNVYLNIIRASEHIPTFSLIIDYQLATNIIFKILEYINFRYGRNNTTTDSEGNPSSSTIAVF